MNCTRLLIWIFLSLFLSSALSSCFLFQKTPGDNGDDPVVLDPITTNNTSDTSRTGNYTPITKVDPPIASQSDTTIFCDTLQQTPSRRIVVCYQKIGNRFIKADTVAVLDLNPSTIVQPTVLDSTIRTKIAYKVVVLLPFMSNNFVPANGQEIPMQSIKAIEFYEGVRMALDTLKAEGVSLFVDVLDTQRDTTVVKNLLTTRALQEADLIIGPVTSKNLSLVAEFARMTKKVLVSPLNARPQLTNNNPYFIQVNPSFDVHARHIVDLLDRVKRPFRYQSRIEERNYLILGLTRDSSRVAAIQAQYAIAKNQYNATIPTLIRSSTNIDISNIKPFLKSNQLNVIVMPTYHNEAFVYNSLRELQKLVDKVERNSSYPLVVIGMDRWRYYNRVNFEYYEDLNLYLTSDYFTPNTTYHQAFRNSYKAVYGIGSREFSLKGFDIMLYFGRMLQRYGVNFQAHLWKEANMYRHTQFQIQARYKTNAPILDGRAGIPNEEGPALEYYENNYLNILEFEEYILKKVEE